MIEAVVEAGDAREGSPPREGAAGRAVQPPTARAGGAQPPRGGGVAGAAGEVEVGLLDGRPLLERRHQEALHGAEEPPPQGLVVRVRERAVRLTAHSRTRSRDRALRPFPPAVRRWSARL